MPNATRTNSKWEKPFLIAASLFALIAIILGAFGAHGLRGALDGSQLSAFETGVRYQFYHALALFIVVILSRTKHKAQTSTMSRALTAAGLFFIVGMILFSGSLYLLSCREVLGIVGLSPILGPITPLGGLCLMIGWLCVFWDCLKNQ